MPTSAERNLSSNLASGATTPNHSPSRSLNTSSNHHHSPNVSRKKHTMTPSSSSPSPSPSKKGGKHKKGFFKRSTKYDHDQGPQLLLPSPTKVEYSPDGIPLYHRAEFHPDISRYSNRDDNFTKYINRSAFTLAIKKREDDREAAALARQRAKSVMCFSPSLNDVNGGLKEQDVAEEDNSDHTVFIGPMPMPQEQQDREEDQSQWLDNQFIMVKEYDQKTRQANWVLCRLEEKLPPIRKVNQRCTFGLPRNSTRYDGGEGGGAHHHQQQQQHQKLQQLSPFRNDSFRSASVPPPLCTSGGLKGTSSPEPGDTHAGYAGTAAAATNHRTAGPISECGSIARNSRSPHSHHHRQSIAVPRASSVIVPTYDEEELRDEDAEIEEEKRRKGGCRRKCPACNEVSDMVERFERNQEDRAEKARQEELMQQILLT